MDLINGIQLIFLSAVNMFFLFLGTVLNTLVIVCISKSTHLRKKLCNFMIMVLSCCDLLVVVTNHSIMLLYLVALMTGKRGLLSEIKFLADLVANTFLGFSLVALLVMSVDRYLSVAYPIFHRVSVTRRRLLILLATPFLLTTAAKAISGKRLGHSLSCGYNSILGRCISTVLCHQLQAVQNL